MNKYEALLEDEDNIFGGTPKSKFWDIIHQASGDLVQEQMDVFFEKVAAMESLLSETLEQETLDSKISHYCLENSQEVQEKKKSLYVELAGDIVTRMDS